MIRCLSGSVEINGKSFDANEEFFDLASTDGSSLLSIIDKSKALISGNTSKSKFFAKLKSCNLIKEDNHTELSSLLDYILALDSISSCLVLKKNVNSLVFPFLDKLNGGCRDRSLKVASYPAGKIAKK